VTYNSFPSPEIELAYNLFGFFFLYAFPMIMIVVCYCAVLCKMNQMREENRTGKRKMDIFCLNMHKNQVKIR